MTPEGWEMSKRGDEGKGNADLFHLWQWMTLLQRPSVSLLCLEAFTAKKRRGVIWFTVWEVSLLERKGYFLFKFSPFFWHNNTIYTFQCQLVYSFYKKKFWKYATQFNFSDLWLVKGGLIEEKQRKKGQIWKDTNRDFRESTSLQNDKLTNF